MMKTGKNKRLLASILAASMLLAMSPFAFALAEGTEDTTNQTGQGQSQSTEGNTTDLGTTDPGITGGGTTEGNNKDHGTTEGGGSGTTTGGTDSIEWNVSRSKTATALDTSTWTSNVTLSLPSAEEKLASDVVFVLDKSTSTELEDQALGMLATLKDQAASTEAKVKVGVVIFNKQANVTPLTDLATGYDDIKTAIEQEIKSGTNTHADFLQARSCWTMIPRLPQIGNI